MINGKDLKRDAGKIPHQNKFLLCTATLTSRLIYIRMCCDPYPGVCDGIYLLSYRVSILSYVCIVRTNDIYLFKWLTRLISTTGSYATGSRISYMYVGWIVDRPTDDSHETTSV